MERITGLVNFVLFNMMFLVMLTVLWHIKLFLILVCDDFITQQQNMEWNLQY